MCGVLRGVVKFLIAVINVLIFIAGAAMLGVGIWLLVDDSAVQRLNDLETGVEFGTDNLMWVTACSTIITVGSLMFVVGFCGCCGVIKENRCLLLIYIILVSVCIVLETLAMIIAIIFNVSLGDALTKGLKDSLKLYDDETNPSASVVAWNNMQFDLQCCGAEGPADWMTSELYTLSNETIPVPYSCCTMKDNTKSPGTIADVEDKDGCYAQAVIPAKDDETVYIYQKGCSNVLQEDIKSYMNIIIGVCAGIIILEIFGVIVACNIRSNAKNKA